MQFVFYEWPLIKWLVSLYKKKSWGHMLTHSGEEVWRQSRGWSDGSTCQKNRIFLAPLEARRDKEGFSSRSFEGEYDPVYYLDFRHLLWRVGRKCFVSSHLVCGTVLCLVAQLCLTVCDSMDCSLPGTSVHGDSPGKNIGVGCHALLQGSSQPRDLTPVSWVAGEFIIIWASREASFVVLGNLIWWSGTHVSFWASDINP